MSPAGRWSFRQKRKFVPKKRASLCPNSPAAVFFGTLRARAWSFAMASIYKRERAQWIKFSLPGKPKPERESLGAIARARAQLIKRRFELELARLKTGDMWPPYVERLDRAARLAAHRGFEAFEEKVVATVEGAIREFENDLNSGILCLRLMSILMGLDRGDKARYGALAERFARDFAESGDWHFSESYWELAEQWYRRDGNDELANRCRLSAAECNVSRAEAGLANQKSDFMYRAHWMGRGLEALRRAKADPQRIDEVHKMFLAMEKQSLSEMTTIEVDRDAIPGLAEAESEAQKQAAAHVQGHPLFRAIIRMANITRPIVLADLTKQYESISEETIWDKIVGTTAIDHFGKVTDAIDPVGSGSEEDEAANQRKRLIHHARTIHWPTKVIWFIEPARLALMEEHAVRRRDLHFLVLNNPFIPPGHEGFYIRGLQAGFYGDWLQATHLLVPQIENSIRYVLNQNGVITTTLRNGIQKEKDINELLPSDEVKDVLGEDLVFDLRGILIERFGHNLRNESAHGLMPEAAFYDAASVYLWWLILHICWKGFLIAHSKPEEPPGKNESPIEKL
jgi:Domain of unknown function (DUF4209)